MTIRELEGDLHKVENKNNEVRFYLQIEKEHYEYEEEEFEYVDVQITWEGDVRILCQRRK